EDGIRYRNVTGVQTCALPIWFYIYYRKYGYSFRRWENVSPQLPRNYCKTQCPLDTSFKTLSLKWNAGISGASLINLFDSIVGSRSEERRVGNAYRSFV